MRYPKLERLIKALLLVGLGVFLYGRIAGGTLTYYINERFAGYTLFAALGLLGVGLFYLFGQRDDDAHDQTHHDHAHHDHGHHDHGHHDHGHSHGLSWGGALLVAMPVILGLLVAPQPLGVAALANREVSLSVENSALPASVRLSGQRSPRERNILEWWQTFQATADYDTLVGQEAQVVGFVFRDGRYGEDVFMATRFVVSCCVADAVVVAMVVQWPETAALENDQWVEVEGVFVRSGLENWRPPILAATRVTPVDIPAQPYLYP